MGGRECVGCREYPDANGSPLEGSRVSRCPRKRLRNQVGHHKVTETLPLRCLHQGAVPLNPVHMDAAILLRVRAKLTVTRP